MIGGSAGEEPAAERLGVARSTAHRLLSTLVYRDFAVPQHPHQPIRLIASVESRQTLRVMRCTPSWFPLAR
ncbi:helix-turn-helix domain-containing protein [Kribbella sp. C-35]|uniref:helix-turn-helix domain-containing protein n=1 Tax=Kribbella sp. C-35 TaxID=2789276 RepID=UPI00397CCBD5